MMDRWHIEVSEQTGAQECEEAGDKIPYNIVNNYFSIGVVSVGKCFVALSQLLLNWKLHLLQLLLCESFYVLL